MKPINIETAKEVFIFTSLRYLMNKGEDKSNLLRLFPEHSHYISKHSLQSSETKFASLENSNYTNSLNLKQFA